MCKMIRLFYAMVPFRRFRAFLIRTHFAACRTCSPDARETEDLAAAVRPPAWISREAGYWPELERRMRGDVREAFYLPVVKPFRPLTGLAAAAGGILAVAFLAVLIGRHLISPTPPPAAGRLEAPRIEVLSAEIQGRPARSSVYQMKCASFIWFYPAR